MKATRRCKHQGTEVSKCANYPESCMAGFLDVVASLSCQQNADNLHKMAESSGNEAGFGGSLGLIDSPVRLMTDELQWITTTLVEDFLLSPK